MTFDSTRNACPICSRSTSGAPMFTWRTRSSQEKPSWEWSYWRCSACGHAFASGEHEAEASLVDVYDDHYVGFRDDAIFRGSVQAMVRAQFPPRLPGGARVLDVGCGNGEFLEAAVQAGYRAQGIDVSQAAVDVCRGRGLTAARIDFLEGELDGPFDAITLWDVVEHLTDPLLFARRARELLRPGGFLMMKTPFITETSFRLVGLMPGRLAGPILHAPNHVQFFSPQSLGALSQAAGFSDVEVVRVQGMRSARRTGGVLKRIKRGIRRALHAVANDGNLVSWMRSGRA